MRLAGYALQVVSQLSYMLAQVIVWEGFFTLARLVTKVGSRPSGTAHREKVHDLQDTVSLACH